MLEHFCYLDVRDRALRLRERHRISFFMPWSFTLFGIFQMIGSVIAAEGGFMVGRSQSGLTVGIIYGVIGVAAGYVLGTVPLWLTWYSSDYLGIRKAKTEMLHAKIKNVLKRGYYFKTASWIAELVLRGEPVESFWPDVLSLLQSEGRRDSYGERYYGWENLNIWFPGIAQRIEGFDPNGPPELRQEYVAKVENMVPCADPIPQDSVVAGTRNPKSLED